LPRIAFDHEAIQAAWLRPRCGARVNSTLIGRGKDRPGQQREQGNSPTHSKNVHPRLDAFTEASAEA
jgi:hypothetical protein